MDKKDKSAEKVEFATSFAQIARGRRPVLYVEVLITRMIVP